MLQFSYLIWIMIFLITPLAILWLFFHKLLRRYLYIYAINAALMMFGIIWDNWGVYKKIWLFPDTNHLSNHVGLLPIEEYVAFGLLFTTLVSSLTIVVYQYSEVKK